ncbi:hypothetical protein ADUPG1_008077, partial [Aduncisulcus paluster]
MRTTLGMHKLHYGFSEECSLYLSEEDHQVCTEVYSGRYAAECEDGYYYDEATYSCVEDSESLCPSDIDEYHMCILADEGSAPSLGCRSAWYGDACDQLYSVHIPDKLFRKRICSDAGYDVSVDPFCDVSEFEMGGISGKIFADKSHITTLIGAQYLINIHYFNLKDTDISGVNDIATLNQLTYLYICQEIADT